MFTYVDSKGADVRRRADRVLPRQLRAGLRLSYVWDAARGGWRRFHAGERAVHGRGGRDRSAPVQVAPTNVIVQFIPYGSGAEGDVIGTGEAWVFSNGQLVHGRVDEGVPGRRRRCSRTRSGEPIALTPGRTWVELAPDRTPVDVVPGAPLADDRDVDRRTTHEGAQHERTTR